MAMRSLFFNSAPGDPRTYQASDLAWYFNLALSTGLIHTDNVPAMQVRCEGTDLRTYIEPGTAIMQGYAFENTANEFMQHALPEATMDRIDRIVLRLDKRNQSRWILPFVKQGVADASPVPPALQRDNFVYELSLAQIRVRANTASLNPADLIDERLDEQLCGLVNSMFSVPTSQFQAQWDAFMASIQNDGFTPLTTFNGHKADYVKHPGVGTTTNSGNDYLVTLDPAPSAYVDHMGVVLIINADATGVSTLNINGLGAKPIKKANGNDVTNLKANGVYTVRYNLAANAGAGAFILQGEGGSGNAQPTDVLTGKTFTNDNGEQVGSLVPSSIKSIQRGTVTLNANAIAVSLAPIVMSNAIVVIHQRHVNNGNPANRNIVAAQIVTNTQLSLYVSAYDANYAPTVTWEVIEFNNVKSVQRGNVSVPDATTTNVSIAEVNLAKSFVYCTLISEATAQDYSNYALATCALTSATNLQFYSQAGINKAYWQVIEFK